MTPKEIIAKYKQKKFLSKGDSSIRMFIDSQVKELTQQALNQILPKIVSDVTNIVQNEVEDLTKRVMKGDPGEKPVVGIDYQIPKDGENYNLTEADKKRISSLIKVPVVKQIVEKVEVIREQPIVTNEIKEVAKYETPEQIIKKVNSKEGSIEITTVKGLQNWLNNLKASIRQKSSGGGGMGQVMTQSYNISSATTTITLPARVASNGRAIWFNYNGQQQQYGVHFTISGITATLLFTPQDNSFIDIIMIRT